MAKEAVATLSKQIDDFQKQLADKTREDGIKQFEAETKRLAVMKPDAQPAPQETDPLEIARLENERRKLDIDAYGKETDRLKVLGTTLTPEAVQALVVQTVAQALTAEPISEGEGRESEEVQGANELHAAMMEPGAADMQMPNMQPMGLLSTEQQPEQPPGL